MNNDFSNNIDSKETLKKRLAALSPAKRALLEQRLKNKNVDITNKKTIPCRSNQNSVLLSFAQQRLWFLEQLEPNTSLYNLTKAIKMSGTLNIEALKKTLDTIVARHEVLRTTLKAVDGSPMQFIAENLSVEIKMITVCSDANQEADIQHLLSEEAQRPFNLSSDLMLRATLLQLKPTEHILILVMHHIASDGWSMGILFREFVALYNAFSTNHSSPLKKLLIQYADFAIWQRQWLSGEILKKQLNYWRKKLAGTSLLELPTDRPRPPIQTYQGSNQRFQLNTQLTHQLKQLSQQSETTLFMTLFAAFVTLLGRYSGTDDIAIGSPIANRNRREIESLIGFFVNTLVLRTDMSGNPSFQELLTQVRQVSLEAYDHQDVPFEQLVEVLQPERHLSRNPLFQVVFALQNAPKEKLKLSGLTLSSLEIERVTAKFDLMMLINEAEEELTGYLEYNTDLFDAMTITRMIGHFQTLLESIIANPEQSIYTLPLLTKAEQHQLLVEWNQTQTIYPKELCIHQLFEAQVTNTPDAIAMVFEDQFLSYATLNQKANQLAHYLQSLGVKPETLVGLCIERSCDMIIGLLGILKAGGAYLPLDIAYPTARLTVMLDDAQVPVLLTETKLIEKLPKHQAQVICLDTLDDATLSPFSSDNPACEIKPTNLAYVMYTSGSTGKPKGISVIHRGVVRLVKETNYVNLTADEVFLQLAPISFDASTFEIWGALLNGAKLIIMPPQTPSLEDLGHILRRYQVNILWLTAGLFHLMVDKQPADLKSVRQLLAGGEVLSVPHVRKALQELKECQLINGYGPTENTTFTCCYPITASQIEPSVPIGRPIANTQVYILDSYLQLVPIGVPGELHISGDGLTRGYLNRPKLTAEKFIFNPFNHEPDARLYKTGDQVRYLPDGNIEYIGRFDYQVKIRGFRIELGEIEAVLLQHSEVREAIVIVLEEQPGNKRLVAYFVPKAQETMISSALRQFLKEKLPDYMVPSAFMKLEAIPLTPNGKVDRRALPIPEGERDIEADFVPPRTPTEEVLAAIWNKILRVERVGIHDNFFELGGHSLLATQVISRLRDAFSIELPLRSLFESPTIAEISEQIDIARHKHQKTFPPIKQIAQKEKIHLSFSQQRLWFLEQLEPNTSLYHITKAIKMSGTLNVEALKKTLNTIVDRHEILRTTLKAIDGSPMQFIAKNSSVELKVIAVQSNITTQKADIQHLLIEEAQRPFDLTFDLMLRATLLQLEPTEHILILVMHHIASDGWSMGILFRELVALYNAFSIDKPSPLIKLPIQYVDFAVWQRQWLKTSMFQTQLNYWQQKLAGISLLELPTDRPRPPTQTYQGAHQRFQLSTQLTYQLKQLSQQSETTLFMTLFTAFAILLNRYSGMDDIVVGSPIANRNHREIEPLIGFFVNTLALRTNLSGNPSFQELLAQVRQVSLEAYDHQDIPFEQLVEVLQPERHLSRNPLFQVMFALQNVQEDKPELSGLKLSSLEIEHATAKFDLLISMHEVAEELIGYLEYNTDLFNATTITRMIGHFQTLLEGIVANPQQLISTLPLLTKTERHQLLVEWNKTQAEYPKDQTIVDLFQTQVDKTPENMAVVFEQQTLSYQMLNTKANQLAHYLMTLGVGVETLVGICVERSDKMVIGLLSILKAGGAYVPLDPNYPLSRLQFMLEDSGVKILLSQSHLLEKLSVSTVKVVCLENEWTKFAAYPKENPLKQSGTKNLAYVIYTSGSTGIPKGVMIEHNSLTNLIFWHNKQFAITQRDKATLLASIAFDASSWELWPYLSTGACVYPVKAETVASTTFKAWLEEKEMTMTFLPTPLVEHFLTETWQTTTLRGILTGGDALHTYLPSKCSFKLYNNYGPTENTVVTTSGEVFHTRNPDMPEFPSIGRPIANSQTYILDANHNPTPLGIPGELCIAGSGLARGYLNRSELTKEKFIANPFSNAPDSRLYKTGDLARYLPNGNIEFLGRLDNQVKIRGFRIELGEIEAVLLQHSEVREAVVIVQNNHPKDKYLVAYIVPKEQSIPSSLRQFIKERLPDYMLPSAFIELEAMPLTPNGKVDRHALLIPTQIGQTHQKIFVAPQDKLEQQLANLWEIVLHIHPIGRHDNFFERGGHSLLAVMLLAHIEKTFAKGLPMMTIFQAPTIAQFADILRDQGCQATWNALEAIQPQGTCPPLFFIGSTNYARALAPSLGTDQPVYGLNIFGLQPTDGTTPSLKVEWIAKQYIKEIQTVQTKGPYYLCGYCNDAKVAFEMAQQLQVQGETIALLAFIDAVWKKADTSLQNSYLRFWHNLLEFGPNYLFYKIRQKAKFFQDRLFLASSQLEKRRHQQAGKALPLKLQHKLLIQSFFQALHRYVPQPYEGHIMLFLSYELRSYNTSVLTQLASEGVKIYEVPGYHFNLFEVPQVNELGKLLKSCLQ